MRVEFRAGCRSALIQTNVQYFITKNLFEQPTKKLKKRLQKHLNLNLNFETLVSDFELRSDGLWCEVMFNNEDGDIKSLSFSIVANAYFKI